MTAPNSIPREYEWQDLHVGMSASFRVTVTEEALAQFLALSGDNNPLHTDRKFAQGRGFRDRVSYGMLTASFYSTLVGVYLPGRNCLLQGVNISFMSPVFPQTELEVAGSITYMNEACRQLEISALITVPGVGTVSKAKIRAGLTSTAEAAR